MNSFGVFLGVLVVILVVLALTRLGLSIRGTSRMTANPEQYSTEGAELNSGGLGTHGTHHIAGHHNISGHHNAAGHHNPGGHIAGGGGHIGGGHHG